MRQIIGLGLKGLVFKVSVDEEHTHLFADRDGQPPAVVELEGVRVDLNFDEVVARGGERMVKDDRLFFTDGEVDRFDRTESAVHDKADARAVLARRSEVLDQRADEDWSIRRDNG